MNVSGRNQPTAAHGFVIVLALAVGFVAVTTVSADTYAPFCEAPIQQCASDDRGPHGTGEGIQLYPQARCAALIADATHRLSLVVRHVESDPHYVAGIADVLHQIAHFCPRPSNNP